MVGRVEILIWTDYSAVPTTQQTCDRLFCCCFVIVYHDETPFAHRWIVIDDHAPGMVCVVCCMQVPRNVYIAIHNTMLKNKNDSAVCDRLHLECKIGHARLTNSNLHPCTRIWFSPCRHGRFLTTANHSACWLVCGRVTVLPRTFIHDFSGAPRVQFIHIVTTDESVFLSSICV